MSRRWHLYVKQVPARIDSPAHQGRFAIDVLRDIRVGDVLREDKVLMLQEDESFQSVLAAVASTQQSVFPVLRQPAPGDTAPGHLAGVIHLDQIRRVLNEDLPPDLIIARDLMVEDVPPVGPETDLATVLRMFASLEVDEVVVWDETNRRILGLLSRREVTRAYVERMSALGLAE
jgi:CIC family chloride channel protein